MHGEYLVDAIIKKGDLLQQLLLNVTVLDGCVFDRCDLSSHNFGGVRLLNCRFTGCDMGLCSFAGTTTDDIAFTGCRMSGALFGEKNGTSRLNARFDGCLLDNALFQNLKAAKSIFRDCRMHETVFDRCDLKGSLFGKCDLQRASFSGNNLTGADFSTSYGFAIDPEDNRIKGAMFSLHSLPGLLAKYGIKIEGME